MSSGIFTLFDRSTIDPRLILIRMSGSRQNRTSASMSNVMELWQLRTVASVTTRWRRSCRRRVSYYIQMGTDLGLIADRLQSTTPAF